MVLFVYWSSCGRDDKSSPVWQDRLIIKCTSTTGEHISVTACVKRADLKEDKTAASGAKANYVCTDCSYCSLSSLGCI